MILTLFMPDYSVLHIDTHIYTHHTYSGWSDYDVGHLYVRRLISSHHFHYFHFLDSNRATDGGL
jgi:hypothetical protein